MLCFSVIFSCYFCLKLVCFLVLWVNLIKFVIFESIIYSKFFPPCLLFFRTPNTHILDLLKMSHTASCRWNDTARPSVQARAGRSSCHTLGALLPQTARGCGGAGCTHSRVAVGCTPGLPTGLPTGLLGARRF